MVHNGIWVRQDDVAGTTNADTTRGYYNFNDAAYALAAGAAVGTVNAAGGGLTATPRCVCGLQAMRYRTCALSATVRPIIPAGAFGDVYSALWLSVTWICRAGIAVCRWYGLP